MKTTTSQPILCGTDFSENAAKAANVAAALATRLNVPLVLAHAGELPAKGVSEEYYDAQYYDAQTASARRRFDEEAERLRALGAAVEGIVSDGAPDEVLVRLARQHEARLIVISSLGRSASARWLLGSIAERTAESSPVPTLVVRDAAPFEAWARGERALKVFVGFDFTASADAALRWIAELRRVGPCEVVAAYVDGTPSEAVGPGTSGPLGLAANRPDAQRMLDHDLRAKLVAVLGEEHLRIRVDHGWGAMDTHLATLAAEEQADLVVIGTHQRHGLARLQHGSVSRGFLRHSPWSVACVPAPAAAPMAGPRIRECQRVLVAVDLNEPHGFAAPYGYSIVQPGGIVRLLHNAVPFHLPNPMGGEYYQDFTTKDEHSQFVAEAEAKLRALAPHEAEARGIVTDVEVTESRETAEAICAAAERFGADAICVGSHTRPGFTAKMLGSVSLAVLKSSRRPVLIVWPPAE